MHLVRMPKADENMAAGTVGRWLVAEGAAVAAGSPLVEIITDKASFELPAEAAGELRRVYAPEKSLLPVGYVLAAIGAPDEPLPDVAAENAARLRQAAEALGGALAGENGDTKLNSLFPPESELSIVSPFSPGVRATPAARRLARERNVDPAEVARALGLAALVREEDVRRFLAEREGRRP